MVGQVLASNHILSLSGQRRMQYGYTIEGWSHHDILALDQPNRTHDGNLTFGINLSASPDVHVVNRHGGGETKIFAIFCLLFLRHGGTRPCYPTLCWKYASEEDQ